MAWFRRDVPPPVTSLRPPDPVSRAFEMRLDETAREKVEAIQAQTRLRDLADVFSHALALLHAVVGPQDVPYWTLRCPNGRVFHLSVKEVLDAEAP